MGAFVSILDFVLNFPVGKTLVEFILVVGVMCVVTDGIAKARNRGDRISLEFPEGSDNFPDETAAALDGLDTAKRSTEPRDLKVEHIVASDRSSDKSPATDRSDDVSNCRENDLETVCNAFSLTDNNNKNHLTEQDTSRNTSDSDDTSAGNDEITNDLMAVDAIIIDVIHTDRTDSMESGIYSSEDLTKSKSSIDSLCQSYDIEEYPTFDDRLNLLSSVCESDDEKRRHLADPSEDNVQTKSSSKELFHRPQSEGRRRSHEMLSDDGWDVEQVELLRQDRDTIRLWNEMILEDNARLNDENLRLRQENEDIMRENERLEKDHKLQSQLHFQFVFVGDSGVGKTSFIRRVCEGKFSPRFDSTVGVDFQSKTMDVDGRQVALQMWDTAGQERFRSITRQYFRKADVAVVMYDVTSENSFKNVRSWMHDVQEGSDDATLVVVIGNKRDLVVDDVMSRKVATTDGAELAKLFNASFYETSAKTGEDVSSSLYDIVRLLTERNKRNGHHLLHSIVRLDKSRQQPTKTNCCGKTV